MAKYSVRYVHKISPRDTDIGPDVDLMPLGSMGRLGLARHLRLKGVISAGHQIPEWRREPDGRIVAFPRGSCNPWHAIILTPKEV